VNPWAGFFPKLNYLLSGQRNQGAESRRQSDGKYEFEKSWFIE